MAITLQIKMKEIMNSLSSMEKTCTSLIIKEVNNYSWITLEIEGEGIELEHKKHKNGKKKDKASSKIDKDKKKSEA